MSQEKKNIVSKLVGFGFFADENAKEYIILESYPENDHILASRVKGKKWEVETDNFINDEIESQMTERLAGRDLTISQAIDIVSAEVTPIIVKYMKEYFNDFFQDKVSRIEFLYTKPIREIYSNFSDEHSAIRSEMIFAESTPCIVECFASYLTEEIDQLKKLKYIVITIWSRHFNTWANYCNFLNAKYSSILGPTKYINEEKLEASKNYAENVARFLNEFKYIDIAKIPSDIDAETLSKSFTKKSNSVEELREFISKN